MKRPVEPEQLKPDLILPWAITGMMLTMLAVYLTLCHVLGEQLQQPLPEENRVIIRTAFYIVAIVTLPLTNLIRHILLRLNQTMPGSGSAANDAKRRYLITVIVSMAMTETIGIFGLIMFILGDGFNTLHILIGVSALGMFLYRPKLDEYYDVYTAISAQHNE